MAGVIRQSITDRWAVYNGDSMDVMAAMPDQSIHASIYSPPFAGLYHYSSNDRDVSNARTYDEFRTHYGMFVQEIYRLTKPGRLTAVHAAPIPSSNTGRDAYFDFPGDVIRLHEENGWDWIARHVIWKEPLAVRNRTMAKNLAHKTICTDAAYAGVAAADELLIFRKRGGTDEPIEHPTGLDYYAGSEQIPAELFKFRNHPGNQIENRYSHWIWRRYASSIWDDVRLGHVLPFRDSKDPDDEKHVHPLQLDVIARFVQLRTRPGETVWTPFMGVGSEVYESVRLGRIGIGAELKPSYYEQALRNLAAVDTPETVEDVALFDEDEMDLEAVDA
jgi:DNA modification methylase